MLRIDTRALRKCNDTLHERYFRIDQLESILIVFHARYIAFAFVHAIDVSLRASVHIREREFSVSQTREGVGK